MFDLRLAELTVRIQNQYPYIEQLCRDYLTDSAEPDFTVSVTEEEIRSEGEGSDPAYLESLAVYRKISEKMLDYDGFLMHGAVLETKGEGVAFLAKSGTGKTTHLRLWQALLGEDMTIVNGDKPLLRWKGDRLIAYGTPWAGKEGLQSNTAVPLKKLCFIERAEKNECIPLANKEAFAPLFRQIYRPKNFSKLSKTMDLIGTVIEHSQFFVIRCNMEPSAAETAYRTLFER